MPRESRINPKIRSFTISDQKIFARFSGDFNPIHISELEARRTISGECIVHGVHSLLWSLECFASKYSYTIQSINVTFLKPIFLNQAVIYTYNQETTTISLTIDEIKCVNIKLTLSDSDNLHIFDLRIPEKESKKLPNILNQCDIVLSKRFEAYFYGDKQLSKQLFPHLRNSLGEGMVCELASLSEIIGMQIPGMNSLYKSIKIDLYKFNLNSYIEVIASDSRLRLIKILCKYPSFEAIIEAYFRPLKITTNSCAEIHKKVEHKDFRNIKAFILGGSRGLGSTVAKLIAVGGGSSLITYNKGEKDAIQIKSDINYWGGECDIKKLDVLVDQMRDLDLTSFNQIYYFASPKIRENRSKIFNQSLYLKYCEYYINGFEKLAHIATRYNIETFFYPSTIFVDKELLIFKEYIKAKIKGEDICRKLNETTSINFICPRLPMMNTDQNLSILPIKLEDPCSVMQSYIKLNNKF
tara:strand:- start:378 stop:1781 length:1404 start_codon:yes stop_codon:yes gene_type:complete